MRCRDPLPVPIANTSSSRLSKLGMLGGKVPLVYSGVAGRGHASSIVTTLLSLLGRC